VRGFQSRRRPRLVAGGVAALLVLAGGAAAGAAAVFAQGSSVRTLEFPAAPRVVRSFVTMHLRAHDYRLDLRLTPNRATVANRAAVELLRRGTPVTGAHVRVTFTMLDMPMSGRRHVLHETAAGRYAGAVPALGMNGRWGVRVEVTPKAGLPFSVDMVDRVSA
jgi:YtkA-like protein